MTTVYTFHRAEDHAILATAEPSNLQTVAATVAASLADNGETRRAYVHNGRGVIAAGLCRQGRWNDILRDDYMGFALKARLKRAEAGLPND